MTPADGAASAAATPAKPAFKPLPQKGPDVSVERRADGSVLIWSNHAPGEGPRSIAHLLKDRAGAHPDVRAGAAVQVSVVVDAEDLPQLQFDWV